MLDQLKTINVITGHYGSGKTNLAINLAFDAAQAGKSVVVIDLDIVNPYFRAADQEQAFLEQGIQLVKPLYANTNLDIPALPGEVAGALSRKNGCVIVDVGGDDAGAIALGTYANLIGAADYAHFHVINQRRGFIAQPADALEMICEIETASKVPVTGLVNATHLCDQTTPEVIEASFAYAHAVERLSGRPLVTTAVKRDVAEQLHTAEAIYPIAIYVNTIWRSYYESNH